MRANFGTIKVAALFRVTIPFMSDTLTLHPLTQKLLENRGISDPDAVLRFLYPDYDRDISDPFLILNMEKAVERILSSMKKNERIVIYGDYDCDGIPGSVVLHDLFRKIGYLNVINYIPHRHLEGYGLNMGAIEQFAKDGTALVITVDCGITDVLEVARANELGMEVIVTDHHLPQEVLPPAFAVINSKQEGDTYPDNMLCGAGVAWKLATAILARGKFSTVPEGWEKWLLDMAGLSTIADMVPLQNENRAIAHFGLKVLRKSARPGLQALLQEAGVEQRYLTEEDVGFTIAPRINAASRMDIPFRAFELLASNNIDIANERARHLASLNSERKLEVARMMKEAKKMLKEREIREVIVVGNPQWRVGVVGIIANNIATEFDRPTFAWGRGEHAMLKGSCRSDGRVNIVELMLAVRDGVFVDRGGHEFSGGFSLTLPAIHTLEDELIAAHGTIPKKESKPAAYTIDGELKLAEVNEVTFRAIDILAPFGVGNPRPHFLIRDAEILVCAQFGGGKNHMKIIFKDDHGEEVTAIGFFMTPSDFPGKALRTGGRIDLVTVMEKSHFRGKEELRLRIIDIKK